MTFTQADERLRNTKGKWKNQRRKVANNTYLERHDGYIGLRLHNTTIIRWYPNGRTTLTAGGWETPTTKDRINTWASIYINSYQGDWYFAIPDGGTYKFVSGMEIGRRWSGYAAGYRTWDAIMDLAEDNRRSTCLWPGVVEECTPEGTARAIYERLCDELEVPRAVPAHARRDLGLHAIMTRWSRAMCAMRKAAEAA